MWGSWTHATRPLPSVRNCATAGCLAFDTCDHPGVDDTDVCTTCSAPGKAPDVTTPVGPPTGTVTNVATREEGFQISNATVRYQRVTVSITNPGPNAHSEWNFGFVLANPSTGSGSSGLSVVRNGSIVGSFTGASGTFTVPVSVNVPPGETATVEAFWVISNPIRDNNAAFTGPTPGNFSGITVTRR